MENRIGYAKFVKLEFLSADVTMDEANDKSEF